jgi:hypothetical protein
MRSFGSLKVIAGQTVGHSSSQPSWTSLFFSPVLFESTGHKASPGLLEQTHHTPAHLAVLGLPSRLRERVGSRETEAGGYGRGSGDHADGGDEGRVEEQCALG